MNENQEALYAIADHFFRCNIETLQDMRENLEEDTAEFGISAKIIELLAKVIDDIIAIKEGTAHEE